MSLPTRSLMAAPAAIAFTLMVGASPTAAAAAGQANCVGEFASTINQFGQTFGVQGLGGRLVSEAALRERGVARYASIDNCD